MPSYLIPVGEFSEIKSLTKEKKNWKKIFFLLQYGSFSLK